MKLNKGTISDFFTIRIRTFNRLNRNYILQYRSPASYSDSLLPVEHINHIAQYAEQLTLKLEEVALAALQARKPSLVSWGQGQVAFAENRRGAKEIVDRSMPLLKVTELNIWQNDR